MIIFRTLLVILSTYIIKYAKLLRFRGFFWHISPGFLGCKKWFLQPHANIFACWEIFWQPVHFLQPMFKHFLKQKSNVFKNFKSFCYLLQNFLQHDEKFRYNLIAYKCHCETAITYFCSHDVENHLWFIPTSKFVI